MTGKKIRSMLFILMMGMMLVLAGCNPENGTQESSSSTMSSSSSSSSSTASSSAAGTAKSSDQAVTRKITVYFPDENGEKLIAETRTIHSKAVCEDAVEELLKGPEKKGSFAIFPKKTKLIGVTLKNGTAKVNFNRALKEDFTGGSTGEEMLVGSLVDTLTAIEGVKNVQILIEGKEIDSLSGHLDLSTPVGPMKHLIAK